MNQWPPSILLAATQGITRQFIRDSIRKCGIREIDPCYTSEEVFLAVQKDPMKWEILIFDSALNNPLETVKKIRGSTESKLKIILVFSGPTPQEISDAIQAGVNEILTYPFSQATIERKLHKLTGTIISEKEKDIEKRRFPRFDAPILVVAPSLSDSPLVPEDISAGGLKVSVLKRPIPKTTHDVSIQVSERLFERCKVEVGWINENSTQPVTWSIGLVIHMLDTEREKFSTALNEAFAKLN